jgi:hypothetical protein
MILTKTADVLAAVAAGARISAYPDAPGLLRLVDADGNEVRAWQTALKSAQRKLETCS